MSGTEDFGTAGYGAGDAERAAAEAGPGGSARNAPPTGPRVHVPAGQHQGAGAGSPNGAAAANGGTNGAPWLAAGSVPYAEAMFGGGAGQDGPRGPGGARGAERGPGGRVPRGGGAGVGRRGVPEAAPQAQTAGPGYPDGYGPEYGQSPERYTNGYAQHPGQPQQTPPMPQLPQQRYDAAPFDSGFTEQTRLAAQAQAAQQPQPPQQQPRQPQQQQQHSPQQQPQQQPQQGPHGGYEQQPSDLSGSGFESGHGYEQAPYQGRPYPGALPGQGPVQAQRPGFDEPTTEFMPGPLFDEPTVQPASPPPGPAPVGSAVNGRASVFSPRQSPQGPQSGQNPQGGPGPQGGQDRANGAVPVQRPSMSGSGTWSAASPSAGQRQAPQPQAPRQHAPQPQRPPQAAGVTNPQLPAQSGIGQAATGQPGTGQTSVGQPGASQPPMSFSGIPRVPSQQAAEAVVAQSAQSLPTVQPPQPAAPSAPGSAPLASANAAPEGAARSEAPQRADSGYGNAPMPSRPPLPDEPPPGPPPLPIRPPRAERQAQQAQSQAQPQAQAQPQSAAQVQAPAQAPLVAQAAMASATTAAVRETLTPPRRMPQPPPAQQSAAAFGRQQSPDDLTSERLRSVAPSVPAPRVSTSGQTSARATVANNAVPTTTAPATTAPAAPPTAPAQSVQEAPVPQEHDADEGELVVPWQATGNAAGNATADSAQPVAASPEPDDLDEDGDDDVLHGSGAHHPAPQPQSPTQPQPQAQAQPPEPASSDQAPATAPQQPQQQPQPQVQVQPEQVPASSASSPTIVQPSPTQPGPEQPDMAQQGPTEPQSPEQEQSPVAAPTAPAASPVTVGPESAAGPENAAPVPPTLPAPRGTRRRVPETAAESDPRSYGSTAAQASDVQRQQAQDAPQHDDDPDFDDVDLPTAPQPLLRPAAATSAAATRSSAPPAAPSPAASASQVADDAEDADEAHDVHEVHDVHDVHDLHDADDARASAYDDEALAAVYRVIHERRDVRNDFLADPVPTEVLTRILEAAHTAPSVGFSQPWDFLVIRDRAMRQRVHDLAVRQRRAYSASLPKARARAFAALKVEAILDTPINIVVTCDPTRGGRHTLGRYTQPLMAPFSSCLAVENLWLAARAEGLGVGWVSFFDERELAAVLDLPDHLQIVAYLCVGYVKSFPPEPELAGAGWAQRRPLAWAVHEERFGHRALPGAEPISLLSETVAAVRGLDQDALGAARDRQARMTKPPGSLGTLEALSEQLSGLAGVCPPPLPEPAALAVFAADHGVHAQGVTPWPQEVTAQMVANFLAGGAVVNAFAKQVGAEVCVVDVGVNADLTVQSGLIPRKIRYGTADMTQGPALTREEATAAIEAGIETARDLVAAGNRCLLTGDMGIANTTASAALIAAFTGASPAQVTGYGTGIDEQTYAHKVEVVRTALELHQPDPQDPVGVLCAFGGLEHAALAGFILGASALRVPVVLDGVIAGAAALVAQALSPEVTAACVAGHRSAEPGHALALEQLGITPLIDLELRLGEGSGAALALPLVGAAVRALREVATFDSAGVSDASSEAVAPPSPAERERT